MTRPIRIVAYDATWPAHYARTCEALVSAVGEHIERVEHIGSTAVPGLAAKPVIDILVGVGHPALIDTSAEVPAVVGGTADIVPLGPEQHVALVNGIKDLGYTYRGINGIPKRLYWWRRDIVPSVHIHLVLTDSAFWRRHLLFRDYLRSHPEEAAAYGRLKRDLALRHGHDVSGYTDAKTAFITACEERASDWLDP